MEIYFVASGGFFKLSAIESMISCGITSGVERGLNPIPAPAVYSTLMVRPMYGVQIIKFSVTQMLGSGFYLQG